MRVLRGEVSGISGSGTAGVRLLTAVLLLAAPRFGEVGEPSACIDGSVSGSLDGADREEPADDAPEPSDEPASASGFQSISRSAWPAVRNDVLAPPGRNASSSFLSFIPPAISTSWFSVVPTGTS